jgi:hypothetical protein
MEFEEFKRRFKRIPVYIHIIVIIILFLTWSWVISEMSKPQIYKCGGFEGTKEELIKLNPVACGGDRYVNLSEINFSSPYLG